jgi:hypothetical protein
MDNMDKVDKGVLVDSRQAESAQYMGNMGY